MDSGEPWELFDLEADLQVTLSEDGKDYLRQFGLEQYDFENYQPDDDPGKYFQDVPLEQNPEALLDLLTRESFRQGSSKRASLTAPPRHSGRKSSARQGNSASRLQNDVTSNRTSISSSAPTTGSLSLSTISSPPQSGHSTGHLDEQGREQDGVLRTGGKRVSFHDNGMVAATSKSVGKENKSKEGGTSTSRAGKSMANFFGRPKVRSNSNTSNSRNNSPQKKAASNKPEQTRTLTAGELGQDASDHSSVGSSSIDNVAVVDGLPNSAGVGASPKKQRKFKFQMLDLMGRNKKTPAITKSDRNPPANIEETVHTNDRRPPQETVDMSGVDRVDLLQGSPELSESRGVSGFSDSDSSDTYATSYPPPESNPRRLPRAAMSAPLMESDGMIEVVTTEASNSKSVEDAGISSANGTEHLPNGLLAAATGNLQLLKESISRLSLDSLSRLRDSQGNTVLHASTSNGHLACVEFICIHCPLLLTAENKAHLSPTVMAIKHGQIDVLDWLIENMNLRQELSPSQARGRCLLHHAAKFGQDGCLRLLLSKMDAAGQLQDYKDQHGNTPAHFAAKYGHLRCLQSLVEYGMDVCSLNDYSHTPCYYADFNNHRACAGYLVVVETCATMARQHVIQSDHSDWLQTHNDVITVFTSEALGLSSTIARQSADDMDVTCRLQQALDDAVDLVGDMASQLNRLYDLTMEDCADRRDLRFSKAPGKDELRSSMERATDLQQRLEELDLAINHQRSRQQLLKVKDVQGRWAALRKEPRREVRTVERESRQLMRKLVNEATQRLVVYRTTSGNAHHAAPYVSPEEEELPSLPTQPDRPAPELPAVTSAGVRRFNPAQKDLDSLLKLSPRARAEFAPSKNNKPSSLIAQGSLDDVAHVGAVDSPNVSRGRNQESNSKLHGEQEVNTHSGAVNMYTGSMTVQNNLGESGGSRFGLIGTKNQVASKGSVLQESFFKGRVPSETDRLLASSVLDSSPSGSSLDEQQQQPSGPTSPRSNAEVKNNVVESFLQSRLFYQRDNLSGGSASGKGQRRTGALLNPSSQRPTAPHNSSEPLGLQLSEFSAFNRVLNRPSVESSSSTKRTVLESSLSSESSSLSGSGGKPSATAKQQGSDSDPRTLVGNNHLGLASELNNVMADSTLKQSVPNMKRIVNDRSANPRLNTKPGGLVTDMVSKLESKSINNVTEAKDAPTQRRSLAAKLHEEEDVVGVPTIPPPPLPPSKSARTLITSRPPPGSTQTNCKPLPASAESSSTAALRGPVVSAVSSSGGGVTSSTSVTTSSSSVTSSERGEEDLLSDFDLGPELDADDLMLGPHGFLDDMDDEHEGGTMHGSAAHGDRHEQFVDEQLTEEELLALAPTGRLPLSMQFETSLSTIEEVSVVSESTRADGEITDAESAAVGGKSMERLSDSDETVTQPSDNEENHQKSDVSESHRNLLASSPVAPTFPVNGERPWYETSDDDEGAPGDDRGSQSALRPSLAPQRPEHFTLF